MKRVFFFFALLWCGVACSSHALPTDTITVGSTSILVELAHKEQSRRIGLMYRDTLPADEGMLFIYPKAAPRSFWMKNTRIPLSIAFANEDGVILQISEMKALSTKHTRCESDAKYALEVNKGWFQSKGIKAGDSITNIPTVAIE